MIFFKGRKASEELTLPSYYFVLDLFFKPITAIIIYENLSLLPWAPHQS